MTLSEQNQKNLEAMKLVEAISSSLGTGSWLWGGFVPDVYAGHLLREHDDLDYLTWNLYSLRSKLAEIFLRLGWQAQTLENGDLKLEKDGVKVHLGNIEFKVQVKWTHNGEKGYILFPVTWLRIQPVRFYDVEIHAIEPEFQYVLGEHPELLNPHWQPREKDIHDTRILRDLLLQKNANLEQLSSLVFSL
jgi:hypothetical protein